MFDVDEAPEAPPFDPATFEKVRAAFASGGPVAAREREREKERRDDATDEKGTFYFSRLHVRELHGRRPW